MAAPPHFSAFPALQAAVAAYSRTYPRGVDGAVTHTVHTFGSCTFTLTFIDVAKDVRRDAAQNMVDDNGVLKNHCSRSRSSSNSSDGNINTAKEGCARSANWKDEKQNRDADQVKLQCTSSECEVPCTAMIYVDFRGPYTFSTLNMFHNCLDELGEALSIVAPHCSLAPSPLFTLAENAAETEEEENIVRLVIPASVSASERGAVLCWVAEWRVKTLLPVCRQFLCHCAARAARLTCVLLPRVCEKPTNASIIASLVSDVHLTDAAPQDRTNSCAQYLLDQRLAQVVALCATPLPSAASLSKDSEADSRTTSGGAAVPFVGTISAMTCVFTRNELEAVLMRRYLNAFTDTDKTSPVKLSIQESQKPPAGFEACDVFSNETERSTPCVAPPPVHVWWCTMILGPHPARNPDSLEKLLRLSLRLRETILFHVQRERAALHALLRRQLDSYAAQFA